MAKCAQLELGKMDVRRRCLTAVLRNYKRSRVSSESYKCRAVYRRAQSYPKPWLFASIHAPRSSLPQVLDWGGPSIRFSGCVEQQGMPVCRF